MSIIEDQIPFVSCQNIVVLTPILRRKVKSQYASSQYTKSAHRCMITIYPSMHGYYIPCASSQLGKFDLLRLNRGHMEQCTPFRIASLSSILYLSIPNFAPPLIKGSYFVITSHFFTEGYTDVFTWLCTHAFSTALHRSPKRCVDDAMTGSLGLPPKRLTSHS